MQKNKSEQVKCLKKIGQTYNNNNKNNNNNNNNEIIFEILLKCHVEDDKLQKAYNTIQ